jgi:hypothetical protein
MEPRQREITAAMEPRAAVVVMPAVSLAASLCVVKVTEPQAPETAVAGVAARQQTDQAERTPLVARGAQDRLVASPEPQLAGVVVAGVAVSPLAVARLMEVARVQHQGRRVAQ